MTGQPFRFEGALPEGFVYDSEPASRAVVTVAELGGEATFPMFRAIQAAFYNEGRDVTRGEVLAELAADQGVDPARFHVAFASEAARAKTLAHFQLARQLGVRAFPTLVLYRDQGYQVLATGWRSREELAAAIDAALG